MILVIESIRDFSDCKYSRILVIESNRGFLIVVVGTRGF